MNKKNFLTTSLASVAVLGAVFFASQTSVVKAADITEPPTEFVGGVNGAEPAVNDIKPYAEVPKDAPVADKPEYPKDAPSLDKGPLTENPNTKFELPKDAPVLDKAPYAEVPKDAPVADKPEYPLNKKAPAAPAKAADKPAAKEDGLKVLPKTGTTENAALASVGFLGLVLGALPFAKRKN